MNDAVFLEAIISEPDEMAHRLVYADWLEDTGEEINHARAEFIRLQCRRQVLHPGDARARRMLAEERRLLGLYQTAWAGDLPQFVDRFAWHRGFIEEVSLTPEQAVTHGERVFRHHPVRIVQLRALNQLPSFIDQAVHLQRLRQVLGRIRILDMNRQYISESVGRALLELPHQPHLEALLMTGTGLTPEGLNLLAESPILDQLQTLEITVLSSDLTALANLLDSPRLTRLRRLSLSGSRGGGPITALLGGSRLLPRLRELSLEHGLVDHRAIESLVREPLPQLRRLDLGFNILGPEGMRELARASLPGLRDLGLSHNYLIHEGARILGSSRLLGQLLSLDLSLNQIGIDGADALIRSPYPSNLLMLDLIYNELGGRTMTALRRRFGADVCVFFRNQDEP